MQAAENIQQGAFEGWFQKVFSQAACSNHTNILSITLATVKICSESLTVLTSYHMALSGRNTPLPEFGWYLQLWKQNQGTNNPLSDTL